MKYNKKLYLAPIMKAIKLQENYCLLQQSGDAPVGYHPANDNDLNQLA